MIKSIISFLAIFGLIYQTHLALSSPQAVDSPAITVVVMLITMMLGVIIGAFSMMNL